MQACTGTCVDARVLQTCPLRSHQLTSITGVKRVDEGVSILADAFDLPRQEVGRQRGCDEHSRVVSPPGAPGTECLSWLDQTRSSSTFERILPGPTIPHQARGEHAWTSSEGRAGLGAGSGHSYPAPARAPLGSLEVPRLSAAEPGQSTPTRSTNLQEIKKNKTTKHKKLPQNLIALSRASDCYF